MKNKITLRDLLNFYINNGHDILPPVVKYDNRYYVIGDTLPYVGVGHNWGIFDSLTEDDLNKEIIVYQEGGLFPLVDIGNGDE